MDWFARDFIKSSLVWLAAGVTLGVCMAIHPAFAIYSPAHMHMNVLGFVTMMIYGVGYHVLPRFGGAKLWSKKLPAFHFWASNAGLGMMVVGLMLRVHVATVTSGSVLLALGGSLSAFGAYAFVFNLWKTLSVRPFAPARTPAAAGPHAPPADRYVIQSRRGAADRPA